MYLCGAWQTRLGVESLVTLGRATLDGFQEGVEPVTYGVLALTLVAHVPLHLGIVLHKSMKEERQKLLEEIRPGLLSVQHLVRRSAHLSIQRGIKPSSVMKRTGAG